MATKIITKNSSTATSIPTAGDLVQGELAVNVTDKRLFTEDSGGAIVELGTNPSTLTSGAATFSGDVSAGGVTVSSANAALLLLETDTTDVNSRLVVGGGKLYVQTTNDADTLRTTRLTVDNTTGDVSLYENTGTTPKFFWDASAESLGIGTTSAPSRLTVKSPDNTLATNIAQFDSLNGGAGFKFGYQRIEQIGATVPITFETGGSESMRIDASGNLLVGTTQVDVGYTDSGAGASINSDGFLQVARSSVNAVGYFNKLDNYGQIIRFSKDGAAVGSIGVATGPVAYMVFNETTSDNVAALKGAGRAILPSTNAGADKDGTMNLGSSGARFESLYLSGGVYLGGTGAANKLDDYEEGTWTPTVNGVSGTLFKNAYIKVGNQITVTAFFDSVSWNAGLNTVDNLPFTNGYGHASGFSATDTVVIQQATVDGTQIKFRAATSGTNKYLMFAATYILD